MDPRQQPGQPQYQQNQPVNTPEVYNSPTLNTMPYGGQPAPQPQTPVQPAQNHRRGPVIAIIVGIVVALLLVLAAIFATSSSTKTADQATTPKQSASSQVIEPAEAIEVEQTNNSISQDLSTLDEEKDFPATGLDDKSLGL